ncbi:MAG TPA: hypothetical protein VM490_08700, partial [Armatimonadaceae bacterium]|nr:hypothetical protein [Armatimonadaceae bacterium]
RESNLVLWGDPGSNRYLARIAANLPLRWDANAVRVGNRSYPAVSHVPALIYPNPSAPGRYVVVNSGFTFRDRMAGTNALHVPMLPDWAVRRIDGATPAVADAGFFDESWALKP